MKGIVFTQYLLSRRRVNGPPTFFINGERYDGTYDLEHLLDTDCAERVMFSSPPENCGYLFVCTFRRTWLMFRPQCDNRESNDDAD